MNQQGSQVWVAALADPQQATLDAAEVLSRNQAQPRREQSPVFEGMPVADGCNNRCRHQRPHSFDGGYASAIRRVMEGDLNPLIGSGDLLVQLRELFVETLKKHPS